MSIRLIKITNNDLELIAKWRMLPEVTAYMYTDPVLTLDGQMKWFDYINNRKDCKYWIIEFNEKKIGVINLCNIDYYNKRCSWAYYIGDMCFRAKGIGKTLECNIYDYVFNTLNLNKLCCEVFSSNEKVIKLHEIFGSDIEGKLKEHIFKNGAFHDIVIMGISKNKWEQLKANYKYEKIYIE